MDSPRPARRFGPYVYVALFVVLAVVFGTCRMLLAQPGVSPIAPTTFQIPFQPPSNVIPAGASLQTTINNAPLGTTILLQAGANYGAIQLPQKSGTGWIYLMTNSTQLPAVGNRVTPADASKLAKIAVNGAVGIQPGAGAHHYRIVGVEVSLTGALQMAVVNLAASPQPTDIVIDRCYIHGSPLGSSGASTQRRGVTMHGRNLAIVDSWVSDFKENGADSQAVWSANGTGPLKIQNNYLSAAGENLMFGGADPATGTEGPSDVEVLGNYFYKPLSWKGQNIVLKNLFELKNVRRLVAKGNIFENNWAAGQNGFSILITPRNQDGSCPTKCGVQDVVFTQNILLNGQQGVNLQGEDDTNPSTRTDRILISQNSFQISGSGAEGKALQIGHGPNNSILDHNTWTFTGVGGAIGTAMEVYGNTPKGQNVQVINNILPVGQYGIHVDGCSAGLVTCLNGQFSPYTFTATAYVGGNPGDTTWPAGNFFPATIAGATMNGLDGKPVGADKAALATATACTVSGQCAGGVIPPPQDTTPPVVTLVVPVSGATYQQNAQVTFQATATDNQPGVGPITFTVDGTLSSSTYTFTQPGSHVVQATARDAVGNVGSASAAVTITPTPPPTPTDRDCVQGPWAVTTFTQTPTGFTVVVTRPTTQTPLGAGKPCGPSSQTWTVIGG